jgi:hypothetical protein
MKPQWIHNFVYLRVLDGYEFETPTMPSPFLETSQTPVLASEVSQAMLG